MEPGLIVILLFVIALVVVVVAVASDGDTANQDRARHEQQIAQMGQVKDVASQQIRELNRAYRAQVSQAARELHRRRTE